MLVVADPRHVRARGVRQVAIGAPERIPAQADGLAEMQGVVELQGVRVLQSARADAEIRMPLPERSDQVRATARRARGPEGDQARLDRRVETLRIDAPPFGGRLLHHVRMVMAMCALRIFRRGHREPLVLDVADRARMTLDHVGLMELMLVVADGARLSVHDAHRDHPVRDLRELVLPERRRMRTQRHLGPRSDVRSGRTMAGGTTVRRIEPFFGNAGEGIALVRSRHGPRREDPPTPSASEPDEQARDGHSDHHKGGPAAEIPERPLRCADQGRASARTIRPRAIGARPAVFLGPGAAP